MKAPAGGRLPPPEAAFPRRRSPSPAGGRLPPPEVAFPHGEGGTAKGRDG